MNGMCWSLINGKLSNKLTDLNDSPFTNYYSSRTKTAQVFSLRFFSCCIESCLWDKRSCECCMGYLFHLVLYKSQQMLMRWWNVLQRNFKNSITLCAGNSQWIKIVFVKCEIFSNEMKFRNSWEQCWEQGFRKVIRTGSRFSTKNTKLPFSDDLNNDFSLDGRQ